MKNLTFIFTLFIMAFTISCENMDQEMSDDELIQAIIESENRISVAKNDLPKSAIASINFDMPNDIIRLAELAPELGYEIELKSWDFFDFELDYERDDNKYFATNGRKTRVIQRIIKMERKKEGPVLSLFTQFHTLCQIIL